MCRMQLNSMVIVFHWWFWTCISMSTKTFGNSKTRCTVKNYQWIGNFPETLCQELQREGQNEYAGICSLEAAKCQETLQNHMEHANLLVKSSKFFLDAREPQKWFETDPNSLCSNQISSQGNLQVIIWTTFNAEYLSN